MQANTIVNSTTLVNNGMTFSAWIRPTIVTATNCRFNILDCSGAIPNRLDLYRKSCARPSVVSART